LSFLFWCWDRTQGLAHGGKHCTTELHSSPVLSFFCWSFFSPESRLLSTLACVTLITHFSDFPRLCIASLSSVVAKGPDFQVRLPESILSCLLVVKRQESYVHSLPMPCYLFGKNEDNSSGYLR
jgi:hypothetical protein